MKVQSVVVKGETQDMMKSISSEMIFTSSYGIKIDKLYDDEFC